MQITFEWNRNFRSNTNDKFQKAQKFVDSECIRLMVPYTPALNNVMYKTATEGTVIGSGRIIYTSPCARYQYYGKLMVSSVNGSSYARSGEKKVLTDKDLKYNTFRHTKAGKLWFERMKKDHKTDILKGAKELMK